MGFEPSWFFSWGALLIELVGGPRLSSACSRASFAAAVAIEMLVIFFAYWHNGFSWLGRGYEYVLLWGLVTFAIAFAAEAPTGSTARLGSSSDNSPRGYLSSLFLVLPAELLEFRKHGLDIELAAGF